ncbi:MAG: helix-turn-helix transcriptional regulator [Verrucomicrobia bacterium]|nr:helix-turn-helix transcriptional regulator [Verrucomicrobiota bacterium]
MNEKEKTAFAEDLPPPPSLSELDDNLPKTIDRLMAECRGRPVAGADLTRELGLPESQLRITFKTTAGIPSGNDFKNYRINKAMSLLRTSTLSITDITGEAGLGSPQSL